MRVKLLNQSFGILFRSQFVYLLENLKNIKRLAIVSVKPKVLALKTRTTHNLTVTTLVL